MDPVIKVPSPRNEAGVPLGGIGAGKLELCADGRITNVTTNNNVDCPITDGLARTPLMPRVLEGAPGSVYENSVRRQSINSPEGLPGAWLAVHTPQVGARLLKTVGRRAFSPIGSSSIDFEGRFPVARYAYRDLGDLELRMEAYSSFDTTDESEEYRNSALPLALFELTARNTGAGRTPVTLAFSWQNLSGIGGYAGTPINRPDPTPPVYRTDDGGPGLWFAHAPRADVDPRTLGDHSLRVRCDRPAAISFHAGWELELDGSDVWSPLSDAGRLADVEGAGRGGALAATFELEAGTTGTVLFALAWSMPHLLAAELRWDHLVRPSSAPPPPSDIDRRDYGHVYQRWFADSWETAGHGLANAAAIRQRVADWHAALDRSSLPAPMATALSNDLCAFVSATWYTRDGSYAMNESPTDMNGCMGTLDQRGAGCGAVATLLPGLDRSELAMFARDQIRADGDDRRFGPHHDTRTGGWGVLLDRAGAILHDVGWDHLEGGRLGDRKWSSAHWPELTSLFVLQGYQHALLTGDVEWLESLYPRMKEALRFQVRLDQDGCGVADLWGPASCTYDTELYPYFGASSYTTGLFLAALAVLRLVAAERGDGETVAWSDEHAARATRVMEEHLWDEEEGYYISWWKRGVDGVPDRRSPNSQVSQLAGAWWADILGVAPIVDADRRRRALEAVYRMNVEPVSGCPADEASPDGTYLQSMAALVVPHYGANAIAAGLPDLGWEAIRRIYRVRYEIDRSPWDSPLQWSGPGNEEPQWGRWYMSNPSSWYLPMALAGVRIDRLRGRLSIEPSWPTTWGDVLDMPVFLPGVRLRVRADRRHGAASVSLEVESIPGGPIRLDQVSVRLPGGARGSAARAEVGGGGQSRLEPSDDGWLHLDSPSVLARVGDGLRVDEA